MLSARDRVQSQLDVLRNYVRSAQSHHRLATAFADQIEKSAGFSLISFVYQTKVAHMDVALAKLYKVTDKTRGTVTVERFLNLSQRHPEAFGYASRDRVETAIAEARARLLGLSDRIEKLRTRRNKADAHLSKEFVEDPYRWEAAQDFKPTEIGPVLSTLEEILNQFRSLFYGPSSASSTDFFPEIDADVEALFDLLAT